MSTNTLKQALEIVYGDIKNINKRVKNLESASAGVIYTETTKSAVAYQDNVSANACPYALLNIVGSMSYKSANLKDLSYPIMNYYRNNSDNFISTADTNTIRIRTESFAFEPVPNKTYYINNIPSGISLLKVRCYDNSKTYIGVPSNISDNSFTISLENVKYIHILFSGSNFDNNTKTLFNQIGIFESNIYQPYFDNIRDTKTTSVISKDSNNTALQTITIPNEIQQLEGYGWGINNTCYNYIDFNTKKFIQNLIKIPLKDLDFSTNSTPASGIFRAHLSDYSNIDYDSSGNIPIIAMIDDYEVMAWNPLSAYDNMKFGIGLRAGITLAISMINQSFIDNLQGFIDSIQNKYLYVKLKTPIETDISQYLPADFNSIQIEPNGTITFENTYQQAIPYEYLYLEKVGANNE